MENEPIHFLVVEDNSSYRRLLTHHILESGHGAWGFADAESALKFLPNMKPEVVISNLMRSVGMDGREFAQRVRQLGWQGVLMVWTNLDLSPDEVHSLEAEKIALVSPKPTLPADFREILSQAADQARGLRSQILQSP